MQKLFALMCFQLLASGAAFAELPPRPASGLDAWAEPRYQAFAATSYNSYTDVQQEGYANTLIVQQQEDALASNLILASQQGASNTLTVTQTGGGGNIAQVLQQDSNNVASIVQSYNDLATLTQSGGNNSASITMTGGNNSVIARQYDGRNDLTVNVSGNVQYNIVQTGGFSVVVNGRP